MIVSHLLLILHKKIQFYIFMFEAWNVAKGRKVQVGRILSQGTVCHNGTQDDVSASGLWLRFTLPLRSDAFEQKRTWYKRWPTPKRHKQNFLKGYFPLICIKNVKRWETFDRTSTGKSSYWILLLLLLLLLLLCTTTGGKSNIHATLPCSWNLTILTQPLRKTRIHIQLDR